MYYGNGEKGDYNEFQKMLLMPFFQLVIQVQPRPQTLISVVNIINS